jgi:hypothetical protein
VTRAAVSRDAPKVTVRVINASPIEISSILLPHKSEVVRIEKLAPSIRELLARPSGVASRTIASLRTSRTGDP